MWIILIVRYPAALLTGLSSSSFASFEQPFPIVIADSRSWNANFSNLYPNSDDNVSLTNPVYEFSVCAWSPSSYTSLC